jgi:hypothetical protein
LNNKSGDCNGTQSSKQAVTNFVVEKGAGFIPLWVFACKYIVKVLGYPRHLDELSDK